MRTQRFLQFMNRFPQNAGLHGVAMQKQTSDFMASMKNTGGVVATLKGAVRNESSSDAMELMFHDAIGDWWTGSDSDTVVKAIKDAKGRKIRVDINSFGGDAYAGISIYNALVAHDAEVEIIVSGIAYSAASIIAMAGDTVKIAANGTLGIHPASIFIYGNKYDMDHYRAWLDSIDNGIIDTYAARSNQPRKKIADWFTGSNNDGSFFSGTQAVEYGFCDECLPLKKGKSDGDSDADNSEATRAGNTGSSQAPAAVAERLAAMGGRMAAEAAHKRGAKLAEMALAMRRGS